MTAEQINNHIRKELVKRGIRGTPEMWLAREIKREILQELKEEGKLKNFKVTITLSPIHGIGTEAKCDADKTIIKVEPKQGKSVTIK